MTKTNNIRIIKGLGDCVEYLRSIGLHVTRPTLSKYIEKGLPCWYEFGTYHFHVEVLDEYFKHMCRQKKMDAPDEVPEVNGEED